MAGASRARTVRRSDLILNDSNYRPGGASTRICRAARPDGRPVGLYKEYSDKMLGELNGDSLDELICWRQYLRLADRKFVDSFCAFPHTIVLDDDDRAVGILMNEAPAAFLQSIPGREGLQPRHAEALGRRYREDRTREIYYFPPPHKIALLGVFLEQLIWLHDHHIVISDLHPRNTLVTADVAMREIYLLDCDAFWLDDLHAFPPHAPEMWRVGDGRSATRATDLAKFALFTARAVDEDFSNPHFSNETLLRLLPSHHVRQLERMYSVDPSLRTETLRVMAHAWTRLVKAPPGRPTSMYIWTDETGRIRYEPTATAALTPPRPEPAEPFQPVSEAPDFDPLVGTVLPPSSRRGTIPTSAGRSRSTSNRRATHTPSRKFRHLTILTVILVLVVGVVLLVVLVGIRP
jgi:hypothetical protein